MRTEGPFEADTSGRSWWLPLVAMVNAVFVVLSRDHYPEALLLAGFGVFGWLGFRRFRTGSPWLVLALYHGLLLGWRLDRLPLLGRHGRRDHRLRCVCFGGTRVARVIAAVASCFAAAAV